MACAVLRSQSEVAKRCWIKTCGTPKTAERHFAARSLGNPVRGLRAQRPQFRFERSYALEKSQRQRQGIGIEVEAFAQAVRGSYGHDAFAAESPLRLPRIVRDQDAVLDEFAQFGFRQAGQLRELCESNLETRAQPHCLAALSAHVSPPALTGC